MTTGKQPIRTKITLISCSASCQTYYTLLSAGVVISSISDCAHRNKKPKTKGKTVPKIHDFHESYAWLHIRAKVWNAHFSPLKTSPVISTTDSAQTQNVVWKRVKMENPKPKNRTNQKPADRWGEKRVEKETKGSKEDSSTVCFPSFSRSSEHREKDDVHNRRCRS